MAVSWRTKVSPPEAVLIPIVRRRSGVWLEMNLKRKQRKIKGWRTLFVFPSAQEGFKVRVCSGNVLK